MAGEFVESQSGLEQPAKQLVNITPDDGSNLTNNVRGIYVGSGGNLNVVAVNDADGATQTLTAVPTGCVVPIVTKRVMSTGTTASLLIGLI